MIDEEEILDELGGDDAVIGDDGEGEEELEGDGVPKVPGEIEEDGDLL